MRSCNVYEHLWICIPKGLYSHPVHLVTLQPLSRQRGLCFVGLSVCRVSETQKAIPGNVFGKGRRNVCYLR